MKPKLVVLLLVLLALAMVPALAMAKSQAMPEKTVSVVLDARQPLGPQLDAQLGVTSRGPRSGNARIVPVSRGPAAQAPQPRAVLALLNEGFEGSLDAWNFGEFGFSSVGWDSTTLMHKRGQYSLYSAAYNNDEFAYPYYEDDMESWAWVDLDLTGATRLQIRFQYMSDTEYSYDAFFWCVTPDEFTYYCQLHTGSTNDKWRLVKLDSRGDPVMASLLGSPDAEFAFIFYSDYSNVDRGTFVDALRIRATGPNP